MRLPVTFVAALAAAGITLLGFAGWRAQTIFCHTSGAPEESAVRQSLVDTGRALTADIQRTTKPAMQRGRKLAEDPGVINAITSGNSIQLTRVCNDAILKATEIDAVALFNATGEIIAINTIYADGRPIPQERVDRIMALKFGHRSIIESCVSNAAHDEALEFQTTCDITPAFFDSSGLSVAHSVPVYAKSGEQVGVVSTRLRFERITDLIVGRSIAGGRGAVRFVSDSGGFFDEALNRAGAGSEPPIPASQLRPITEPLAHGKASELTFERDGTFHALFRMTGLATIEGGGIQTMISVPDAWVLSEARAASAMAVGTPAGVGLLLLLVAVALRSEAKSVRRSEQLQSAQRDVTFLWDTLDQHSIVSETDAQGRITQVNDRFCAISGYPRAELVGQDHRILRSGTHPKAFWSEAWQSIAAGRPWHGEVCNRTKDGAIYWVDIIISPCKTTCGKIDRFISIGSDITARKRSEQALIESDRKARAILDKSRQFIGMLDTQGRVLDANRSAIEFAGVKPEDVFGKFFWETPWWTHSAEIQRKLRESIHSAAQGKSVRFETTHPTPNGELHTIDFSLEPVHDEHGKVVALIPEGRDITELRTREDELKAATLIAEAASRSKSAFLANMSHEIRTPLTAILGYTDLLHEQENGAANREHRVQIIDTIRNAGTHLLTVINDILDISKIEADRMTVERIETPLVSILLEVEKLSRARAAGKGLTLTTSLTTPVPDRILSDPTRLRQILLNLVGNAVKFTEAGSVSVVAAVSDLGGDSRLVIDVLDTGPGMTEEQAARMFHVFGQADDTVTRKHGGTGLGLTICRRLATLMGGDVKLMHTAPGKGSCFRLVLPLEAAAGSAMVSALDVATPDAAPNIVGASAPLAGRILLAEDGPDNQRLIAFHLRKAGATVEFADNGRIALEMIDRAVAVGTPYDLLLTDMQMPEMDGYTLARTLREHASTLAVVALTAHAMQEDREKCWEAGCDDYATKPIEKAALLDTVARWIGKPGGTRREPIAAEAPPRMNRPSTPTRSQNDGARPVTTSSPVGVQESRPQ
jgi:PAS domain S-box-containing protein